MTPTLTATRRDLSRRRPYMPEDAQPHASNLIEQVDFLAERPAKAELLRIWMAESSRRLAAAISANQ